MKNKFSVAEIVKNIKGRDKDNLYLIYKVECDKIYLVNGDTKLIENPKVKNDKHLESMGIVVENLKDKIQNNKTIYDAEIYSALRKFKQNLKGE